MNPMSIRVKTIEPRIFNFTVFAERKVIGAFQFKMLPDSEEVQQRNIINEIPHLIRNRTQDFVGLNILCHKLGREDRVMKSGNYHSKGSLTIYSWIWEEVFPE